MVLRNLGVVLQAASTGGWRFTSQLCIALKKQFPELGITFYLGRQVISDFESDRPIASLSQAGIQVKRFSQPVSHKKRSGIRYFAAQVRRILGSRSWAKQKRELNTHDVVFFAWPYNIDFPSIHRPIAFLPHDFFYLHFAGGFQYTDNEAIQFQNQHALWMKRGFPVVSTHFIASELQNTFPVLRRAPEVIHLTNLSTMGRLPSSEAADVLANLGIRGNYLLSLNNASYHKNLGQVLAGFYYVQKQHQDLQLVICGHGTKGVQGRSNTPHYIDRLDRSPNVICLGLRSDREITALIQNAKVVINASVYEAGNGSGLDAWYLGTPVAMSSIPPFLEQKTVLGVQAETFNPRCCYELRDALDSILSSTEKTTAMVDQSSKAMRDYSWNNVSLKYKEFFEKVINEYSGANE